MKKAVASAFQANFRGTDEEDEEDPQSHHKSNYTLVTVSCAIIVTSSSYVYAHGCIVYSLRITFSYTPTDEDVLVKMRREVHKSDISDYSSKASKDDIDTFKEEVDYRDGKLQRSSGNTSFHLVNDSDSKPDSDTASLSLSQTVTASGSYNMNLGSCNAVN